MDIRSTIADEIKSIRTSLGLRQVAFVKRFNETPPVSLQISQASLSKYEDGSVCIPSDKLKKINMLKRR